ncbi:MAG: hypothetical protein FWG87_12540 [Defluviitaleaceae bacterium]|nr:hypothetical protein [Defluviitaleaceae bacterium]
MERKVYPCKLQVAEHGFNGFSRILRIGSWENISRLVIYADKIREIRVNPQKSVFHCP